MNRSIQVEGAFGVLKNDYEFQRFLLRGKTRVKLEILMLCMGYNINKLHAKIQKERTGSFLFPVKETKALLKYAKNPKGLPKQKNSFRIFLCIERGYRSII